MNLIRLSHQNPVATIVVFLIVCILGVAALFNMPVQLTPDLNRPEITILNYWRASAPADIESEIVEPMEAVLQSINGVEKISSAVRPGLGITRIEFALGTDMQQAFIDVISGLNQVPGRPREAEQPIINVGSLNGDSVATLLIRKLNPTPDDDFLDYQELIRNRVEPELRRVPGIANVSLQSEKQKQLQITFDPYRMAALGVSLDSVVQSIQRSTNMSGGFARVGRREFTVRYAGQYGPDTMDQMIVDYNNGRPIYLNEVATVSVDADVGRGFAYRNGAPAFYISLERTNGSNTVEIMDGLKAAIERLNKDVLAQHGLIIELSFDSSTHIKRAVDLVQNNLTIGIILAMLMLFWMIRGWRATLLIGLTIPTSICAALFALNVLGRSVNIISLAGLAFAVGLVLDAAIVVQENILRLRQQGMPMREAAIKGAVEVGPALFASTATTVAIFMPVLFMAGIEGQLFFDLAVSMAVAVVMSLISAMLLLPVVAVKVLYDSNSTPPERTFWERLAQFYARHVQSPRQIAFWLVVLIPGALVIIALLTPRPDFLPKAEWEGIFGIFRTPPGVNYDVYEKEVGQTIAKRLQPHLAHEKEPYIKSYNLSMAAGGNILFIYPQNPEEADIVRNFVQTEIMADLPDTRGFAVQASLLDIGVSMSRSVYVHFKGELDDASRLVIEQAIERIEHSIPAANVRIRPALYDQQPEIRIEPDNHMLAQAGVDRLSMGNMARALTSGLYVGEFFDGKERLDIMLRSEPWKTPEELQAMPVATPQGGVLTFGQLGHIARTIGPTEIRRVNGTRAISLGVTPPANITLDETIEVLRGIINDINPQLSAGVTAELGGGSDDLADAISTMKQNFLFAVVILFLILTALFRSVKDSILVLSAMPAAVAGGVLGLKTLNIFSFQALDLLTMIGFVILLGLIVNNAILLVDQARRAQAKGLSIDDAISYAIKTRVRPVYMSSLTSVIGMLPLVVIPGVGSEIYRGLAVVIVGGMSISTLFMLIYMPAALRATDWMQWPKAQKETDHAKA